MTMRDYPQMAHDINSLGLNNLRKYIRKYHPAAVPNMERNIAIIKYCVNHGPCETAKLFCLSLYTVRHIMEQYWGYAKEGLDEAERIREALAAKARRE